MFNLYSVFNPHHDMVLLLLPELKKILKLFKPQ